MESIDGAAPALCGQNAYKLKISSKTLEYSMSDLICSWLFMYNGQRCSELTHVRKEKKTNRHIDTHKQTKRKQKLGKIGR
jgi:hypothetical protein